jgi:hypothetical protein
VDVGVLCSKGDGSKLRIGILGKGLFFGKMLLQVGEGDIMFFDEFENQAIKGNPK